MADISVIPYVFDPLDPTQTVARGLNFAPFLATLPNVGDQIVSGSQTITFYTQDPATEIISESSDITLTSGPSLDANSVSIYWNQIGGIASNNYIVAASFSTTISGQIRTKWAVQPVQAGPF